ncbi:MAG: BglII/BstYI family type II restriction endonuclease [Planctomycetota bacterium]
MRIAGFYSFNNGQEIVEREYGPLLDEIRQIVTDIEAAEHKTKKSKEKTMKGRILFSPKSINSAFKVQFLLRGWQSIRVKCDYSTEHYLPGYENKPLRKGAFREMDFVKSRLGVEIQYGKYSFMVYNVCAKMTIFRNLGHIDCGVEIVPVKAFADEMSSGVSYFEQFVWDLKARGVSNIDIPVLILGIAE